MIEHLIHAGIVGLLASVGISFYRYLRAVETTSDIYTRAIDALKWPDPPVISERKQKSIDSQGKARP